MEVTILHCNEVDKEKWDNIVRSAPNGRIYNMSWYLDAIMPEGWSGIILGDYHAVFPFLAKNKLGIHYITQPPLAQRFDFCASSDIEKPQIVNALTSLSNKYNKITIHFTEEFPIFKNTLKNNHFLPIDRPYQSIATEYNRNTKRNIKYCIETAKADFCNVDNDAFFTCIKQSDVFSILNPLLPIIHNLNSIENKDCRILLNGVNINNSIEAVGFSILFKRRLYFLICGSTSIGKKYKATYYLIDRLIQDSIQETDIFDFTGSNMPDIARRNLGFGAKVELYSKASKYIFPAINW